MSQECQQPQAHPARCGCEQDECPLSELSILRAANKQLETFRDRIIAERLSAPVSPATAEVQVLKFKSLGEMAQRSRVGGANYVRLEDFDAHVTRLQAENAALQQKLQRSNLHCHDLAHKLANRFETAQGAQFETIKSLRYLNEELQQRLNVADQRNDELQSEKTKAQEALTAIANWPDGGNLYGQENIKAFVLAHQSAPAAKEWSDWEVGDTVRYVSAGGFVHARMTVASDYIVHEAPDEHESFCVLDDDGDEISVLVGEFKFIAPAAKDGE